MAAPRKYDQEFRERAVRMYREQARRGNRVHAQRETARGLAARPQPCRVAELG